jgi:hypothetical protein
MQTGFPAPLDNDLEDVAWGLTTGAALWKQGELHDAIVWLKRAVVAATDAGQARRADELNRAATRLMAALAAPSGSPRKGSAPAGNTSSRSAAPQASALSRPPRAFGPSPGLRMPPPLPPQAVANHLRASNAVGKAEASDDSGDLLLLAEEDDITEDDDTGGLLLGEIELLGELGAGQRERLLRSAVLASLSDDEEVKIGGLALVLEGHATIQPTVADVAAASLKAGEFIYGQPSIPDAPALRLVAQGPVTRVALWERLVVEDALADSPEALERLQRASNRVHALAGSVMGSLGERLDEGLRALATERLEVRVLAPNEVLAHAGRPVPGLVIVGVGTIELDPPGRGSHRLGPGDFLFPTEVLGGELAPRTARAGSKGAIVLFGARALTHELLVTCPPLLELFAGM